MAVDIEIPLSDIEEEAEKPSRTYCLDLDKGRIIGMVDGIDAVKQAVEKALSTRRFYCLIYDSDYGCDATDAVHDKNITREYLETAVPEMITDALSQDSRILEVDDFEINFSDDKMHVSFKITTVYGETIIEYTL